MLSHCWRCRLLHGVRQPVRLRFAYLLYPGTRAVSADRCRLQLAPERADHHLIPASIGAPATAASIAATIATPAATITAAIATAIAYAIDSAIATPTATSVASTLAATTLAIAAAIAAASAASIPAPDASSTRELFHR